MPFQFRKEAIEEDLNSNFPSQGQGNPPLYYSLSEVVVPTYSINQVAEGTSLPQNLQTAWDFSTDHTTVVNGTSNLISNTGFWLVDVNVTMETGSAFNAHIDITDGLSNKIIWELNVNNQPSGVVALQQDKFVVFLRSGDSLTGTSSSVDSFVDIVYRQIADVNGNLVNPLGFSFA